MKAVHRYRLSSLANQRIELPVGADLLTVQARYDQHLDLWAMVDPEAGTESRMFLVLATGQLIPDNQAKTLRWVATVQTMAGAIVFHVFEVAPGHNKQPRA